MEDKKNQQQFSSIIGFLAVVIGFAVGVGSLWRFPFMVGDNGGGMFLIVFVVVLFLLGIPILTAEITIGFATQKTPIKAYKELAPNTPWYLNTYLHLAAAILIVSYTIPVYAWILDYLFKTPLGYFDGMNAGEISNYFDKLSANKAKIFSYAVLNWALIIITLKIGLEKGVEKLSKILIPLLAIIMIVIIIIGINLDGAIEGIKFLFYPNPEKFGLDSFLSAIGQAFFATGIGMLSSMVFGSYLKNKKENIVTQANIISFAIVFAGVAAGMMIFPIVFAFGLNPTSGPGLTFITLPNAFNQMIAGKFIGTLFYIGFYIAAFTSAVGVYEGVLGLFMDEFNIDRNKALFYTSAIIIFFGCITILYDPLFDFLDILVSNYLIVIGSLFISIFTGWVWGADKFIEATNVKNKIAKIWFKFSLKYASPVLIIISLIAQFIKK